MVIVIIAKQDKTTFLNYKTTQLYLAINEMKLFSMGS